MEELWRQRPEIVENDHAGVKQIRELRTGKQHPSGKVSGPRRKGSPWRASCGRACSELEQDVRASCGLEAFWRAAGEPAGGGQVFVVQVSDVLVLPRSSLLMILSKGESWQVFTWNAGALFRACPGQSRAARDCPGHPAHPSNQRPQPSGSMRFAGQYSRSSADPNSAPRSRISPVRKAHSIKATNDASEP